MIRWRGDGELHRWLHCWLGISISADAIIVDNADDSSS